MNCFLILEIDSIFIQEVEDQNNLVAVSEEVSVQLQKIRKHCFSLSLQKVRQVKGFYHRG